VNHRNFITGSRSLIEQDLHENLGYFKVPQVGIESTRSKLVLKIFDEYVNILKGMYSTWFHGCPRDNDTNDQRDSDPVGPIPPLITSFRTWQSNNISHSKEKENKGIWMVST
jgi:hypothetical protein